MTQRATGGGEGIAVVSARLQLGRFFADEVAGATLVRMKFTTQREKRRSAARLRKALKRRRSRRSRLSCRHRRHVVALDLAPVGFNTALNRYVRVIDCPANLNLSADYKETVDFLRAVRLLARELQSKFMVDFTSLKDITPAAALLLVAEFDRWRGRSKARRLRPIDLENWTPSVRRRLKEMGFFEVLGAKCEIVDEAQAGEDRYLRFLSGIGSGGASAKSLRQSIEELGPKIADRDSLYGGLTEAMTNVQQHAYGSRGEVRRWWISASVNVDASSLTVMVVDHGLGIPATLPRSGLWEEVRGYAKAQGADFFADDARLLEAAFSVEGNRSQTREEYRGRGLKEDIKGYVQAHDSRGRLRVISKRGKYVYDRHTTDGERTSTERLPVEFGGTFIEWIIEDYACGSPSVN